MEEGLTGAFLTSSFVMPMPLSVIVKVSGVVLILIPPSLNCVVAGKSELESKVQETEQTTGLTCFSSVKLRNLRLSRASAALEVSSRRKTDLSLCAERGRGRVRSSFEGRDVDDFLEHFCSGEKGDGQRTCRGS